MFAVRSGREEPSVVSTRVLRTHRRNSREHFWLQERVRTIDYEGKHNYSQISDQIDGVRQNLSKIKVVKKNAGISVERRKLLRDKGLRILPPKQNGDEDFFTLRNSEGKTIFISCAEFYDGNAMRKQLCIDTQDPTVTALSEGENSCSEQIDASSGESRSKRTAIVENEQRKKLSYRKITPPLRPGSVRNFKDVFEESLDKNDELASSQAVTIRERKYGVWKQTANIKRERQVDNGKQACFVANTDNSESTKTPRRKLSGTSSESVSNLRKKSRVNNGYLSAATSANSAESPGQMEKVDDTRQQQSINAKVDLERKISTGSLSRQQMLRPISATGRMSSGLGISCNVIGLRKMSLVMDKTPTIVPSSSGGECKHRKVAFESNRLNLKKDAQSPCKVEVSQKDDREKKEIDVSKLPKRNYSWNTHVQDSGNHHIEKIRSTEDSHSSSGLDLFASRTLDAPQPGSPVYADNQRTCLSGKISKMNVKQFGQDVSPDARFDKTLSKQFVTMQMTIGNKQVKVYVPKFSSGEHLEHEIIERARAKSAVKVHGSGL
ncbi:uncharacterized protein [Acropora muricata]|uniref:uncharacterized protein n=1 Tax=Acropora muricata TaxID=159855 RepID=UPI0034E48B85